MRTGPGCGPSTPRPIRTSTRTSRSACKGTGGSTAIANSYEQMRRAGATARAMLVAGGGASVGRAGRRDHRGARRAAPCEVGAQRAVRPVRRGGGASCRCRRTLPLKEPAKFRLIGREGVVSRLDSPAKANGTAQFTIDIREPGMLTVVVARPPRFGGKLVAFEAGDARAVRGVVDVKEIPSGVAVYAEGMWPALKGREKLRITWDEAGAEKRSTSELVEEYLALARKPGTVAGQHGDAEAVLARAEGVIEAEYVFPYLAHAPMEPLDGFLRWDGKRALARLGSQLQTGDHQAIAAVLGLKPEQVEVETMLAGGSFGRRAQPDMHLAVELAHAAKAIGPGRPVKLVWTREDDIRGGYYRPLFVHRMRGAVRDGKIVAWANTIVGQSFLKGSPFEAMIKDGIDPVMVEGARELPYDIPDFRCDVHMADVGVPTLWWRSVGHTHTAYAVECFIDELLQAAGQDPVVGRMALLEKSPRHAGVLNAVARLARWNGARPVRRSRARRRRGGELRQHRRPDRRGVGRRREGPRVHRVWCAVDCGIAVNPDVIRAQMEGGIGFGLGHALFAEVTLEEGRPVQAQLRRLPLAAHPRDAAGGGDDRALHREADRRRRARRAADRARGRQRAGAPRPAAAAPPADAAGPGGMIAPRILRAVAGAIIVLTGAAVETLEPDRHAAGSAPLASRVAPRDGLRRHRRHAVALDRPVRGGRQGPAAPALRQLPSRRRAPVPGRRHAPARAAGGARQATATARPGLPAPPATAPPTSIRRACRAIRTGSWRPPRWRGRASRSATSATSSRTAGATATATSPPSSSTWQPTASSSGPGTRGRAARRHPAATRRSWRCSRPGPTPAPTARRRDGSDRLAGW